MIEHLLTPEGRERLSGGWAKLPKPARIGLRVFGCVTAASLLVGLIVWATVAVCMALSAAGHDRLAVFAGIFGTCVTFGAICGAAVYAAEKD